MDNQTGSEIMTSETCEDCSEGEGIGFTLNGPGHTVHFCADCAPKWFDGVC